MGKLKNLQMDVFSGLSEFGKKLELQKNIQNQVLQKQRELNQKVQDLEKLITNHTELESLDLSAIESDITGIVLSSEKTE